MTPGSAGGAPGGARPGPPVLARLRAELAAELPDVLGRSGVGQFLWDPVRDLLEIDAAGLAAFGLSPGEYDGRPETLGARTVTGRLPDLPGRPGPAAADGAGRPGRGEHRRGEHRAEDHGCEEYGGEEYGGWLRVRHPGGELRRVRLRGTVHRDARGRPARVTGVVLDTGPDSRLPPRACEAAAPSAAVRRATTTGRTTHLLSQALSVEDVLAVLTSEEVLAPLGAAGASFSLVENGRLRRYASGGLPEEFSRDERFHRIDAPFPAATALRTRTPAFLTREEIRLRYPAFWPYFGATGWSLAAVLPLVAQGEPVGLVALAFRDKEGFSPTERSLLVALAAAVAQSVQRAVLYDQAHDAAVDLQQAMLPAEVPDVPGARVTVRYRPARAGRFVGGDWYDVVPLPGGRVALSVGDVQGHDVHASAVMGQMRTALRAYATEGHPPAAVLERASAFLDGLDTDRFATCLYADLDPAAGRVELVRAGHHGPLVQHADGRTSLLDVRGGMPLGLGEFGGTYRGTTCALRGGESLLLCTDGLLERHDVDIDTGTSRLAALLRAGPDGGTPLADRLVEAGAGTAPQEDDIALLLVTRTAHDGQEAAAATAP